MSGILGQQHEEFCSQDNVDAPQRRLQSHLTWNEASIQNKQEILVVVSGETCSKMNNVTIHLGVGFAGRWSCLTLFSCTVRYSLAQMLATYRQGSYRVQILLNAARVMKSTPKCSRLNGKVFIGQLHKVSIPVPPPRFSDLRVTSAQRLEQSQDQPKNGDRIHIRISRT